MVCDRKIGPHPCCSVIQGHWIDVLRTLPDESVHCVVTSPPYWGLRDYGTGEWQGGDRACTHQRMNLRPAHNGADLGDRGGQAFAAQSGTPYRDTCGRCGAVRVDQQLGLERTPDEYRAKLVAGFEEVRRVLRRDGICWLNLGDCYATGGKVGECPGGGEQGARWTGDSTRGERGDRLANGHGSRTDRKTRADRDGTHSGKHTAIAAMGPMQQPNRLPLSGLKPKDLVGIPWMVAFALRAAGWYLRQDVIWAKPNPMPEPVRDRCCKAHEYLFLLSKSERYFYDGDAIREPATCGYLRGAGPMTQPGTGRNDYTQQGDHRVRESKLRGEFQGKGAAPGREPFRAVRDTRIKRSVWTVVTEPFPDAHFATFPPEIPELCIRAGTSEHGCCPACGKPWLRIVEPTAEYAQHIGAGKRVNGCDYDAERARGMSIRNKVNSEYITVGWRPGCKCDAGAAIPCTVLDPFYGAGTTGMVAKQLGRHYIGSDLSAVYCAMARQRTAAIDAQHDLLPATALAPTTAREAQSDLFPVMPVPITDPADATEQSA